MWTDNNDISWLEMFAQRHLPACDLPLYGYNTPFIQLMLPAVRRQANDNGYGIPLVHYACRSC